MNSAPTEEEFLKMYAAVHANPPQLELPSDRTIALQAKRIQELEARNEQLELVASYAKDVVDFWPNMSMRTIRIMIPKMDSLKEALGLVK